MAPEGLDRHHSPGDISGVRVVTPVSKPLPHLRNSGQTKNQVITTYCDKCHNGAGCEAPKRVRGGFLEGQHLG